MHPKLGTIEDFDDFVAATRDQGMEVALDLALQCAPDHPWAKDHPEWFTVLPDGTIAYAENPPKKYQDIYPINFDNDPAGLYQEVLRVVRYWISHGVKVFRVDNPHTKPPELLGVADRRGQERRSRRAVPVRGVHPAGAAVRLGQTRLHPVLYVFHLAHGEVGAHRVRRADRRARRLCAPEPVRQHARHPAREPAARRPRHVRDPRRAGRDHEFGVGRLLRLRTVRAPSRARGQRGVPQLREVRAAAPRLRGRAGRWRIAGAIPDPAQRDSPRASGAAANCAPSSSTTSTTTRCWPTASSTR